MDGFLVVKGIAVPWLIPNIDTDTISPMQRLILNSDQLDYYSFEPYRFCGGNGDKGELNMEFPLNLPKYRNARFMIVGENFGCGSSRETAAEAIAKLGIRCIIGSSFAGIFMKNCYQQGILPVIVARDTVEELAELAENGGEFTVNLEEKILYAPDGRKLEFSIEDKRRESLMKGQDDVGVTLQDIDLIEEYFRKEWEGMPWLRAD